MVAGQSFFRGHIKKIQFDDACSNITQLHRHSTPLAAVLSPLPFDLAMAGLRSTLGAVDRLRHAVYANDIAIWTTTSTDGDVGDALLNRIGATVRYEQRASLTCSRKKSGTGLDAHTPAKPATPHDTARQTVYTPQ